MNIVLVAAAALGFAGLVEANLRARRSRSRLNALVRPSHELRGALTALDLGLSVVDRSRPPDNELAPRVDGIRIQLGRAREALAEIDALRSSEQPGGLERVPTLFDLAAIVDERAGAWSQLASGYGTTLRIAWHAGPVRLHADRLSISRALDNVIANALEHGGGPVLVEGERRDSRLCIWISDAGAGFDCSARLLAEAPPSSARGHGLAIAREAIKTHGGRIAATRRRGRAAVVVELPLDSSLPVLTRVSSTAVGREPATVTTPVA